MPIYGLKYHKLSQTAYFHSENSLVLDDCAVVEVDQGQTLARVVSGPFDVVDGASDAQLPRVVRPASTADLSQEASNISVVERAKDFWLQCVRRRHLDMKLVDVEVFLDRSKFIFYFTAPVRIDFRELVKDLVHEYRVRIELRQIGVRHEAQMVGAVGNCGMVCCCRRYLHQFAPVTIRMAKDQNLFLNPTKVSGICGRLLCCLAYEQENYDAFHRESPKLAKKYQTKKGTLKVVRANMFCNTVTCLTETNEEIKMTLEEWKEIEPHRPDVPASTQPQQSSGHAAQDELMVVEASLDDVADAHFLDACFPADSVSTAPAQPAGPVMQPGEGEMHAHKKRHRKSGGQVLHPAPHTVPRPGEEGRSPDEQPRVDVSVQQPGQQGAPQSRRRPDYDTAGQRAGGEPHGSHQLVTGRQRPGRPAPRGQDTHQARDGAHADARQESGMDSRSVRDRRSRKDTSRQGPSGRGGRPVSQGQQEQQRGRQRPATPPDEGNGKTVS